ncbi:uncharacterized protein [Aquarana catesbeiana]|uniref:uncharacterized protein isoform X5 n=1 Tax=Aquarana catesbeiana TaxID=8400 RepID=UPI003CCA3F8B
MLRGCGTPHCWRSQKNKAIFIYYSRTTAAIFTSGTCDRKFSGYIHDPGVTTLEIPVIKKKSFKPTKSSNRGSLQRYQSLYECYVGAVRHIAGGHRRTKPYLFITGIGC